MAIDNGYVIPGLNEEWTLLGAKLNEWCCGMGAFILAQTMIDKPTRWIVPLLLIFIGTAIGLASLRRRFPDEEKGLRNFCFMFLGIQPPGIPAPAAMQPEWSGAPMRDLPATSEFMQLGLGTVLDSDEADDGEVA